MSHHIVHFSDIHVTNPKRNPFKHWIRGFRGAGPEQLEELADAGSITTQGTPKLAVISGDLTADGDEFDRAFPYVIDTLPLGGTTNKGLDYTDAAVIIPGNHDVWGGGLLRGTLQGRKNKAAVLQRTEWDRTEDGTWYWSGTVEEHRPPEATTRGLGLQVDVLTIDSTREGFDNLFATGYVGEDGFAAIRRCQDRASLANDVRRGSSDLLHVTVAVMHHPPHWVHERNIRLKNGPDVYHALREARIGLILCGHEHQNHVSVRADGHPVQVIAGTGAQEKATCSFVTIDFDPLTATIGADGDATVPAKITVHRRRSDDDTFDSGTSTPYAVPARWFTGP